MAIVQSFGALQTMVSPVPTWAPSANSVNLYGRMQTYAKIYERQPNVRTCVDFLSRNIAQLGLQAFRRVSDTDRVRLTDHGIVRCLGKPNPSTRRYRLVESLMGDLGIYFNGYWLKIRFTNTLGRPALGLVRLPPEQMEVYGGLLPTHFGWTTNGRELPFAPSEIVHFNGYNPLNPLKGLSPLDTLSQVLAGEYAAAEHRANMWRNGARIDGVIERPLAAPRWTADQKTSWRDQWQARFAGAAGAGQVAVLEDGMVFKPHAWSPKEAEGSESRKLSREECAAAYHIPLPLVGILEHATFSNVKEQHKHLYQDCLGPWNEMIVQEIEGQLLPEFEDVEDIYLEFNIAAKLAGSFEEQAASLRAMVGRPIMTPNEGRARLNLPAITDDPTADQLAEQQGGPAASADPPAPVPDPAIAAAVDPIVRAHWGRQESRLAKLPVEARAEALNHSRCTNELATDLFPVLDGLGVDLNVGYDYAVAVTDATYTLLLEGADAFAADREVPPCLTS